MSTHTQTGVHSKHRVIMPVSTVHLQGFTVGVYSWWRRNVSQKCVCRYACSNKGMCVQWGLLYKIHDRRQTYPIFHRSPETQLKQRAFRPVTHSNTSLQVWVGWEMASTWLCQQLWNHYLWEGITVSARRNEQFCNMSLIPSGSVSTKTEEPTSHLSVPTGIIIL